MSKDILKERSNIFNWPEFQVLLVEMGLSIYFSWLIYVTITRTWFFSNTPLQLLSLCGLCTNVLVCLMLIIFEVLLILIFLLAFNSSEFMIVFGITV